MHQPAMTPEDVCVLEATDRGLRRLEALGIKDLTTCDKAVRKAIEDLESLEAQRSGGSSLVVRRARWVLEQLQVAPWTVQQHHAAVLESQRLHFSVAGPADPSGGRGEAVSFLNMTVGATSASLEAAEQQRLNSKDLRKELLRLGTEEAHIRPLCRPERLGLLRELLSKKKLGTRTAERSLTELRRCHEQLLQEAFDRQLAALGPSSPDMSDGSDDSHEQSRGTQAAPAPEAVSAGPEEPVRNEPAPLEASQPMGGQRPPPPPSDGTDEDEAAEMARLRAALVEGLIPPAKAVANAAEAKAVPQVAAPKAPPAPRRLPMLKIVSVEKTPLGQTVERPLYVFGRENIRAWRLQQEATARSTASGVGGIVARHASGGYESPRSSTSDGREDVAKRAASDNGPGTLGRTPTKRLRIR